LYVAKKMAVIAHGGDQRVAAERLLDDDVMHLVRDRRLELLARYGSWQWAVRSGQFTVGSSQLAGAGRSAANGQRPTGIVERVRQ